MKRLRPSSGAAKWIRRMSPAVAKADLARFVEDRVRNLLKPNALLNALFTPPQSDIVVPLSRSTHFGQQSIFNRRQNGRSSDDQLPIPPSPANRRIKPDAHGAAPLEPSCGPLDKMMSPVDRENCEATRRCPTAAASAACLAAVDRDVSSGVVGWDPRAPALILLSSLSRSRRTRSAPDKVSS
jgi:hypothetical protein